MADQLTLGGPLLKTPEAPADLPEQWRADLLRALSPNRRNNLALTCSAALDWLLKDWPQATLVMPVKAAGSERPEALSRRLQSAQRELAQRGNRSTTLGLHQQGSIPDGEAWWDAYLAAFSTAQTLATVALRLSLQHIPAQLLAGVGVAFPGLQSLTLQSPFSNSPCNIQLPSPTTLPTLKHLHLARCAAGICPTLASYLPQLVTLHITECRDAEGAWAGVFQPAYRSSTLRRLSFPQCRPMWLAAQLQACAPLVEEVTVYRISPGQAATDSPTCPWKRLRVTLLLDQSDLQWLPMPAEGVLEIGADGPNSLMFVLPQSEQESSIMNRVQFMDFKNLCIHVPDMAAPQQPAAISQLLSSVTSLQEGDVKVKLYNATMTPDLAACIVAAHAAGWRDIGLPFLEWPGTTPPIPTTLPPLEYVTLQQALTDVLLAQLLQCVSAVGELHVPALSLQAPPAEGTVVPWGMLHVEHAELTALARHASLLGSSARLEADTVDVCLNSHEVDGGGYEFLSQQLSRLRLSEVGPVCVRPAEGLCAADEPRALHASFMLVQGLPCESVHVQGWEATAANMQQLQYLPPWQSLILEPRSSSNSPLPSALSHIPRSIPRSFECLVLDTALLLHEHVDAFVGRAPTRLTASQQLGIVIDEFRVYERDERPYRRHRVPEGVDKPPGYLHVTLVMYE